MYLAYTICPHYHNNTKVAYCAATQYAPIIIQWATLVTHHFFRAHIFWQKCLNRTFSMIIYSLTFYLFDNIEKNNGITHANHSATQKAILTNFEKCTCKRNVYIFYLCFVLGIIHGDRCDRKTPKTIYLFKWNHFFRSLNLVTSLLFEWRFNVILTSVTIIKLGFLRKLFCNESLVDIEVSKH